MAEMVTIGAAKENVLIVSGACAVTVLPDLGGKIASIRLHGRELLQAPLAPLALRTQTLPFDASDASGWDECLPSVAACTVETSTGNSQIPDHGDLWRVIWQSVDSKTQPSLSNDHANQITLRAECFSLPLSLERSISLTESKTGKRWDLDLKYTLTNTSDAPVPWAWAAHPLFAVEPGDRVVLPPSVHSLRVEGSAAHRLGKFGDKVNWPIAPLPDGTSTDLSLAEGSESGIGDKLFTGHLGADEGFCTLERTSAGLRIRFEFDTAVTPYIGVWLCYGGWPDRPGPKQSCVALEPSTSPVDSLATSGAWSRSLGPGETCTWPMHVQIELI
jgi:galactose mutarotase-like enzyme